jgi:hypothetical protein
MFEVIYRLLSFMYSSDLGDHLRGWDDDTSDFSNTNIYTIVGSVMLITTLVAAVIYYNIYDHPRENRPAKWAKKWLLLVTIINFISAVSFPLFIIRPENVSPSLVVQWYDCVGFGISNFIISAIFFTFFSILLRYKSRNNRYSPFNF